MCRVYNVTLPLLHSAFFMNVSQLVSATLFLLVSVLSFSVWAFAGKWFPNEPTMYAGCAVVFLGLGGLAMLPAGKFSGKPALRYCISFAIGYLAYAVIWSVAWFSIPGTLSETWGSAIGLLVLAATLKRWNELEISLLSATAILFLFHTLGYYFGGHTYKVIRQISDLGINPDPGSRGTILLLAKLSWGAGYGIGLGVGLAKILYLSRQSSASPSTQI